MARVISIAISMLAVTATALPSIKIKKRNETSGMVYDFADITPSQNLDWVDCFESFKCTYLTVPLDYENPEIGTTNVAFIKFPSQNPDAIDVLYNPGGPGASGVQSLIDFAPAIFLPTFGPDYNYISFDPRGVNNTGPRLSCAPTTKARDEYMLTRLTPSAPLEEHWAQSLALGQFCTTLNENGSAKYAGTSAVVQDMMHFTELSAEAKGQKKEDALINYFGTSYGTLLGQTLAAMYPQRLGRIILDANVYGVDYYAGFVPSALDDTDHSFGFFFSFCYEAGEKLCPLAANATSAGDVETRYRALLQELENAPVVKQGSTGPGFVTRGDLESYAFNAMYSPKQGFLSLAAVVVELEKGNSTIFELLTATPQFDNAGIESLLLITSIDTAGRYVLKNYTDFLGAVTELQQNSFYAWKTYAVSNTVAVNAMEIIPPKSQLFPGFQQTNTSNPILFVATTGDPITPLSSAFKMSAYFEGSRVLTQDTPGHSFLGMATKCTVGHVQAYLANGTMPEVGTICETDVKTKEIATQLFTLPEAPAARMMMERRKFF